MKPETREVQFGTSSLGRPEPPCGQLPARAAVKFCWQSRGDTEGIKLLGIERLEVGRRDLSVEDQPREGVNPAPV